MKYTNEEVKSGKLFGKEVFITAFYAEPFQIPKFELEPIVAIVQSVAPVPSGFANLSYCNYEFKVLQNQTAVPFYANRRVVHVFSELSEAIEYYHNIRTTHLENMKTLLHANKDKFSCHEDYISDFESSLNKFHSLYFKK